MKNRIFGNLLFLTGILSALLVFGLVLAGCPTEEDDDGGGGGEKALTWTAVTDKPFGTTNINGIAYGGAEDSERFVAVGSSGKAAHS
ncbi:MAG: hypothetical protein LBF83_01720, partial [Spirochaetaceae bacterium]|nr:hypothetical protein [Spirochaetaceae bacterium]